MRKHTYILFAFLAISHMGAYAKKSHRKSHKQKAHTAYASKHSKKKRVSHKTHDLRPTLTLDDVKDLENLWGIDISHYQSTIDWEGLATEKPNFMFIKASEGIDIQDSKYISHYTEARRLGIPVGSYHFFSYKSPGKEQANNFLAVAQHNNGDLLPVLDAEYTRSTPKDRIKVAAELSDFVNTVYEKLGKYPIIYCNYSYYQAFLTEGIIDKCKLWIVDYKNQPTCPWTFWQTTDRFKLTSIKGHVDLNIFNGTQDNLKELFYYKATGQL
jgi:lysozyme